MNEQTVYLLWHSRGMGNGNTDDKLVGVYSTQAAAEGAIARKLQFEGFRDFPEGFLVAPYELDHDAWSEGFISSIE